MTLLAALDLLLLVGLTLRLTRLVVVDDLGYWLVQGPAVRWAGRSGRLDSWQSRLVSGLGCPYCVGFWLGVLALASLALVGGPGGGETALVVWRWVAGAFALNEVIGFLAGLNAEDDDEDDA